MVRRLGPYVSNSFVAMCIINVAYSAPTQPCQVTQKFSEEVNIRQPSQWLSDHPKVGTDYQAETDILKGTSLSQFSGAVTVILYEPMMVY